MPDERGHLLLVESGDFVLATYREIAAHFRLTAERSPNEGKASWLDSRADQPSWDPRASECREMSGHRRPRPSLPGDLRGWAATESPDLRHWTAPR